MITRFSLKKAVQAALKSRGSSQSWLANQLGIRATSMNSKLNRDRDKTPVSELIKLSVPLQIEPGQLLELGIEQVPNPAETTEEEEIVFFDKFTIDFVESEIRSGLHYNVEKIEKNAVRAALYGKNKLQPQYVEYFSAQTLDQAFFLACEKMESEIKKRLQSNEA